MGTMVASPAAPPPRPAELTFGDKVRFAAHVGAAGGLVALSLWWVIPLHSFAGPVLLKLTRTHGVHVGDLPTLPFLAAAVWSGVAAMRMLDVRLTPLRQPS